MSNVPVFQPVEGDRVCLVCGKPIRKGSFYICSDECHQKFIDDLVDKFGEFKRVVGAQTGIAYKIPTRDILERGLRHVDLVKYPEE